ncbi:MAG TPA: type IV toxin-antitoxin system AbiEi family antitoxin domain-containing protein [Synergistales bacterium]|nr:type IV toxin-antitoxin system AbiEi family antitoxin domain-containing protein [Synergistales bacterium]HRV71946.1 type IV toxin-antitoxin system AbiEi family antitoxin domain-containing protein [Thermovirgaceae bacterium]
MRRAKENGKGENYRIRFLKSLVEDGLTVFSVSDARRIAEESGIPRTYINRLLSFLVRDGWITRLKRGLFARIGPLSGDIQIHPFAIATHMIEPSAISHWSALHHHGLTEQVPGIVTAITPKKIVTPSMRLDRSVESTNRRHGWLVEGVRYEYRSVKEEHYFGVEEIWVDQYSRIPIMDRERAALDLFVSPGIFGGMGEVLGIMDEHLASLDVERLVGYACRYGKIAPAKRLGWILERSSVPHKILEPLLAIPAAGYLLLDPSGQNEGIFEKRWNIRVNLGSGRIE